MGASVLLSPTPAPCRMSLPLWVQIHAPTDVITIVNISQGEKLKKFKCLIHNAWLLVPIWECMG